MTKELQDLAWRVLPAEFKEEVKNMYNGYQPGKIRECLIMLFGIHNLTSDAEGEEVLTVSRKRVQEFYAKCKEVTKKPYNYPDYSHESALSRMALLDILFGSKCLPDEVADEDNFASKEPRIEDGEKESFTYPKFRTGDKVLFNNNICRIIGTDREDAEYQLERIIDNHLMGWAEENEISLYEEPNPAEPKFHVGDKVRVTKENCGLHHAIGEVLDIDNSEKCFVLFPHIQAWFSFTDLEPYTEPEEDHIVVNNEMVKDFDTILKDSFSKERRLNIAAMAMQGMLSHNDFDVIFGGTGYRKTPSKIAELAVLCADALIAELNKKKDGK